MINQRSTDMPTQSAPVETFENRTTPSAQRMASADSGSFFGRVLAKVQDQLNIRPPLLHMGVVVLSLIADAGGR